MNGFKSIKQFVKDEKHAGSYYPGLKVNYVKGHNPDLILFDNAGKETSRIDLTKYDKRGDIPREEYLEKLHALMKEQGFTRTRGSNQYISFATSSRGEYRFIRFTTVQTREPGSMVQLASFEFADEGVAVRPVSCRNPGGESPKGEEVQFLIQTSLRTKWIDKKAQPVIFDFGQSKNIDGFRFATGHDPKSTGRDPVRWKLEGSISGNDEEAWTMLHDTSGEDFAVHMDRSKWIIGNLPASTHGEL